MSVLPQVENGEVQTFTCLACGIVWSRPTVRGMQPKRCPACRRASRSPGRTCLYCGTSNIRHDATYCSRLCASIAGASGAEGWSRRGKALRKARVAQAGTSGDRALIAGSCAVCGQQTIWTHPTWRTCSRRCRNRMAYTRTAKAKQARKRIRRLAIFERDSYMCALCGLPTMRHAVVPHDNAPTIDHIIPAVHGGTNESSNLQCAHFMCNVLKGDRIPA